MKKCYLLLFLPFIYLIMFTQAIASDNEATQYNKLKNSIDAAITKFEQTNSQRWSFTVSRFENEEGDITRSVEHYNPHAATPWQLIKTNGQSPTSAQIKRFTDKKSKQNNAPDKKERISMPLRKFVDLESLTLICEDESTMVVDYNVHIKKLGDDAIGKLRGTLVYNKSLHFIETLSIVNTADFSPMISANITDLALSFNFINNAGSILLKQNKMNMKGTFAYFTQINETSTDHYTDYQLLPTQHAPDISH